MKDDRSQSNVVSNLVSLNTDLRKVIGQLYPFLGTMSTAGFANFIDEWSQFDFCFTNFGGILEYLESSMTLKKPIFRLSSPWSWHVYTIVRDTRSSCGGPPIWKAHIHWRSSSKL